MLIRDAEGTVARNGRGRSETDGTMMRDLDAVVAHCRSILSFSPIRDERPQPACELFEGGLGI